MEALPKLPDNVPAMPAERRQRLKQLAEAASQGQIEVGTTRHESKGELVHALECETEVYPGEDCPEAGPLAIFSRPEDAEYFAAARPDVALATLAYVEAVEAANDKLAARMSALESQLQYQTNVSQMDLEHVLDSKRTISSSQGWALLSAAYLRALLILEEEAESQAARVSALQVELAEQGREKLAMVQELADLRKGISPDTRNMLQRIEAHRLKHHAAPPAEAPAALPLVGEAAEPAAPKLPSGPKPGSYSEYCLNARNAGGTYYTEKEWLRQKRLAAAPALVVAEAAGAGHFATNPFYPAAAWSDDDGTALWWKFPIQEPPYVGSPADCDWNYEYGYTHFQKLDLRGYDDEKAQKAAAAATPLGGRKEADGQKGGQGE
jgi:hypothetical protein